MHSARYARRGVSICGYSNSDFDDIAQSKALIHSFFVRAGIGHVDHDDANDFRGHYSLDATNHYFTPSELVKHETYNPYPTEEDPFGTLDDWYEFGKSKNPLIRVSDNDVLFYEKVTTVDDENNTSVITFA